MHNGSNAQGTDRVRQLLTQASIWKALPYLAFGIAVVVVVVLVGRDIESHIGAIESWIAQLGPWGPLAFVVFFILGTSLLMPDTVLCIIAGALFGSAWGGAAVLIGSLLAAALQFALSRRLLKARIERALSTKPSLVAIQQAVRYDELRLQLLLRLTPLNPAAISYLLGAAGVRFGGFLLACLALVPSLLIEVYFGHAGKQMARMAGGHGHADRLRDLVIIVGVVIGLTVMVLVSRMARKAVMQAVALPTTAQSQSGSGVE